MRRRWLVAALALTVCALLLAACGGGHARRQETPAPGPEGTRYGPFAGYYWYGPLTAISARWRVPRIAPGSPTGDASDWIGAEAPGPAAVKDPFIQIGTVENRFETARGKIDEYDAFWSATRLHFHPRMLFAIAPGDEISAQMALASGRWQLSIRDLSSGRSDTFTTADEGGATFNLAQWIEEDPGTGSGSINDLDREPFPALAPATFTALQVDHRPPARRDLEPNWMALPSGGPLGPVDTPAGFTVRRVHLTASGRRFAAIAAPETEASEAFFTALKGWSAATPPAVIRAASRRMVSALDRNIAGFAAGPWPAAAHADVAALLRSTRALRAVIARPPARSTGVAAWRLRVKAPGSEVGYDAGRLRTILGTPLLHVPGGG